MFHWLTGSSTKPPILLKSRSSKTFIIVTVSTAIFTDVFLYGIIVPVLPFALTSRSGVAAGSIQTWISIFLAVYGGALLITSPLCGWVADRTSSRRMPLILGLLALAGATIMLCIGSSIGILAAGRVLQGISAAVVWVVGLALLVDTVGSDGVGQAMGYVGLSMSLAILVAPLLGGVVFAAAGYYAVFAMAFGLIGLDIFLRVVMIEKKVAVRWLTEEVVVVNEEPDKEKAETDEPPRDEEERADSTGIEMSAVDTQSKPKSDKPDDPKPASGIQPPNNTGLRNTRLERLPPVLYLLSSRRVLSALWGCMIQAALLTAFDSILPLFCRNTFHWNSIGAGLIFLPVVIVTFVGPIIGYYSDKLGPRWFATAGFILATPFLILLRLVSENTVGHKVLLCALLALIGICLTLMITPMMAEITYAVDAKASRRPKGFFGKNGAYAQAYSLFNMAWAAGCLVGPLLAGLVNQRAGWGVTTLILGVVSAVTAIPAVIWTGGSIWKLRRARKEGGGEGLEGGQV
jgi:MFS family permease